MAGMEMYMGNLGHKLIIVIFLDKPRRDFLSVFSRFVQTMDNGHHFETIHIAKL